jgi:hypothetical protein
MANCREWKFTIQVQNNEQLRHKMMSEKEDRRGGNTSSGDTDHWWYPRNNGK